MSYPVGRDFIPSMAHNELVRSKVETAVGTIINPLDKSEVSISTAAMMIGFVTKLFGSRTQAISLISIYSVHMLLKLRNVLSINQSQFCLCLSIVK